LERIPLSRGKKQRDGIQIEAREYFVPLQVAFAVLGLCKMRELERYYTESGLDLAPVAGDHVVFF
jgi:hypothetical protein